MKVVYFDLWTNGIRCFKPFDNVFKSKNIETKLIHLGSYSEKHLKHEVKNNIEVYDIKHYKTNLIYKALQKEKPNAVISLNTTFIWDRALILACKELQIPCFFAMHGDFFTGNELQNSIQRNSKRNSLIIKLPKLYKYIRYHFINFIYSYIKSKNKPYGWSTLISILWNNFRNPAKERHLPTITSGLHYDKAFIYSEKYINHYLNLGYKKENIIVTGYPEYDDLYTKITKSSFDKNDLPDEVKPLDKYVVYLEPAYADSHLYNWDNNYRNKHLTEVAERLKQDGLKLIVKIHPSNTKEEDIVINSDNAIVIKKCDLETLVNFAEYCIIQTSTSNNIPLLLNKNMVFPRWGLSKDIKSRFPNEIIFEWGNSTEKIDFSKIDNKLRTEFIDNNYTRINNQNASEIIYKNIVNYVEEHSK